MHEVSALDDRKPYELIWFYGFNIDDGAQRCSHWVRQNNREYRDTFTNTMLGMDFVLTMVALYVPIRAHFLWILLVATTGIFVALLLVFGSAAPDPTFCTLT